MTGVQSNPSPDHSAGATSAYRAYLIGRDGKIETFVSILAENDADAIAQVETLTRTYEVELWDRSRVVLRMPTKTMR